LDWDAILCVSAEEEVVFDRLEKRGFNRRESAERIAAQFSLKKKESRSDVVLRNSGSLDDLESKLIDLVDQMQKKFAGKDCYFPAED
jgi:dephospho-CoA kinase